MPTPKPKSLELKKLIEAELHKPRSDELVLKRLEREADSLLKSQDADSRNEGLIVHGVVQGLRFDIEGAKRYFSQALAASGNSVMAYMNYASILGTLGLFSEALSNAELAVAKAPDDPAALSLALKLATDALDLEKAEHFADRLKKLDVLEKNSEAAKVLESLAWQYKMFEFPDVTREALFRRYESAREVASVHCLRIAFELGNCSSEGVLVEWFVDCSDDEIAAMNLDVSAAIAALEPDPCDALVAFGYTSKEALASLEQ